MHTTTLDLGRYATDPRLEIVQVEGRDAIRTNAVTIVQSGDTFQVWPLNEPNALYPLHTEQRLDRALSYALGTPAKVGPVGMGEWLHTDGRVYLHDPATTAMVGVDTLHVGDVVDFPDTEAFEIVGDVEILTDRLGRRYGAYPVRIVNGGFNEYFRYGNGDLVPVRTGRRRP